MPEAARPESPHSLDGQAFILFENDLEGEVLAFTDPREHLIAHEADDVLPMLQHAQTLRERGYWIAGYLSYEAGYALDPALQASMPTDRRLPLLHLAAFGEPTSPPPALTGQAELSQPVPLWQMEQYRACFDILHNHIARGDCYQANLTFPFELSWSGTALSLFASMRARQPVRYAALVNLGGPTLLSRSPELFFRTDTEGWIETHPMKGTMPRGQTEAEDEANAEFLRNDVKSQAENRMIVDLLRNDISRVTLPETLDVPDIFRIESYPTVHQMVSTVRARLMPGIGLMHIMQALFPCGSVTGAPKISAMKILRKLESGPRGAYCGAIGWAAPDGSSQFNVAIRTLTLFDQGEAALNAGGGIVFDSVAESEYEEALLKARFASLG
ncbi:aminodeoxychorismate synthase component I [Nitratireductor basaltis]|uniref:Aminodeoxychorismate synthase n=1 Tax=Nitratireductor basaltis TaxID=472175 RepID=A0A084U851_9HYPH|nr:aminodeoxychorismate synthase component I [Nitratireductor basaltis]KFB09137.1 Aminodeoxychorismate synthase [Nitratireductor basaltis]